MGRSTRTKKETLMVLEINNFSRLNLAQMLHELDFKVAVEVGVASGWYSNQIMKANPQLKLYGVDPWVPYKGYSDYTRTSTFSKLEDEAHERLDKFPNYEFVKEFSMDALSRFADDSLDFVYIDANHGDPYVTQDITEWYKKVRPGGILAGHDYIRSRGRHGGPPPKNDTIEATNKFTKDNNLILFLLGTNAIREGEVRDKIRSWMIQK
jgi:SAM-dependent methyltransferase